MGCSTALIAYLRVHSSVSAVSFDGWAYVTWGQALARGEAPLYFKGGTTPKPLPAVLTAIASPLSPRTGAIVLMCLALGLLAAGLFLVASRHTTPIVAPVAVLALFALVDLPDVLEISDGFTAALVVLGVALRGRSRVAAFVCAGLFRPEPWILAAFAGWTEMDGSRLRRAGAAFLAGVAAPVSWMIFDLVVSGDPLATYRWLHWGSGDRIAPGMMQPRTSFVEILEGYRDLLFPDLLGSLATIAGAVGLTMIWKGLRVREGSGWPAVIALVGLVSLAALVSGPANLYARYLLPLVITMLAVGTAVCFGLWGPLRRSPASVVVVTSILVIGALAMTDLAADLDERRLRSVQVSERVSGTIPVIEAALGCGRVGLAGNFRAREYIPFIAGMMRVPADRFGVVLDDQDIRPPEDRFASVIRIHAGGPPLPDWPRYRTDLGRMAVSPSCGAMEGIDGAEPVEGA